VQKYNTLSNFNQKNQTCCFYRTLRFLIKFKVIISRLSVAIGCNNLHLLFCFLTWMFQLCLRWFLYLWG